MIVEGASLSKPLAFLGEDFPYWKDKMEIYVKSTHYQLWQIITCDNIKISSLKEE